MGVQVRQVELSAAGFKGLIAEDVMAKIWDISKIPLPLTDMIGSESAQSHYKEWITDVLATPDVTNANIDGNDITGDDGVVGTRNGNYCQIADKVVRISERAKAVKTLGVSKQLSEQLIRRQQEVKRDIEAIALTGQASVAGDGVTAPKMGGLAAWLTTSDYFGAGGAATGFNTSTGIVAARTRSTAGRALSVAELKACVQSVYNQGGSPSVIMLRPEVQGLLSTFLFSSTAVAAIRSNAQNSMREGLVANGAVSVFATDFGFLDLVPNRIQQPFGITANAAVYGGGGIISDVFVLSPEYLSFAYLSNVQTKMLGSNGLSDRYEVFADATLCVKNEKAHGVLADINSGTAVVA